jgi:hypothetical protein
MVVMLPTLQRVNGQQFIICYLVNYILSIEKRKFEGRGRIYKVFPTQNDKNIIVVNSKGFCLQRVFKCFEH